MHRLLTCWIAAPTSYRAERNPDYEGLCASFKDFNHIQNQVFTVLYSTDDTVLVAAPTGGGPAAGGLPLCLCLQGSMQG